MPTLAQLIRHRRSRWLLIACLLISVCGVLGLAVAVSYDTWKANSLLGVWRAQDPDVVTELEFTLDGTVRQRRISLQSAEQAEYVGTVHILSGDLTSGTLEVFWRDDMETLPWDFIVSGSTMTLTIPALHMRHAFTRAR